MNHAATDITPGLFLYTSNRMETLAARLADRLRTPLPSPLQPEILVVRNKGMERWLKLELASRHGVCANHEFPFPEAFGHRAFRELLPRVPEHSATDREVVSWRILRLLPSLLERPEFLSLRHYLGAPVSQGEAGGDPRKALQLAGRIANLFDQYLIFRPKLILDWDAGAGCADSEWQPILWREISRTLSSPHTADLWRQFGDTVAGPELPPHGLPPRVSIFGVSALPPFHLDLFAGLARHLQINLFLLQPSQEYWGEITSPREGERILRKTRVPETGPFGVHLDPGNRLLASLGYLGRDFLKLVLEAGDWVSEEAFTEPGHDSLLHRIQSDILHLRDDWRAEGEEGAGAPPVLAPGDDSIRVHCCHSPLRELEVLQDHITDWLERDPGLNPRDIVVMTPDIELYAPLVQAVFGAPEEAGRQIPFSVADRGGRHQSRVVDTFLRLLALPESRLGAGAVLQILEAAPVREKFRLEESDLALIRQWVEETGICWGIDAAHREQLHLPSLPGNTWRQGLDRLLLGYAMSGGDSRLFRGVLPHDELDSASVPVLSRFLSFMERVIDTTRDLDKDRTLAGWIDRLEQIIDDFLQVSEESVAEIQLLRDTLSSLRQQQQESGFEAGLALSTLLDRLGVLLEEDRQQAGFLSGGVTFCGLKPMRSIPFRVVCLIGMNDGAFPRATHHLGFDLMARRPRLGDRSTREDDRYLFLETLLSARDRLHLSHVGLSIRDNSEAPPSVLISELLDYVAGTCRVEEPTEAGGADGTETAGEPKPGEGRQPRPATGECPDVRKRLVVRHPLQPFSARYFEGDQVLFSYSEENCLASGSARLARAQRGAFCGNPLPPPEEKFRTVSLAALARFLANPARTFLAQRLNIFLPRTPEEREDREPFVVDPLSRARLTARLVEQRRRAERATAATGATSGGTEPPEPIETGEWLLASGQLPLGEVGHVESHRMQAEVDRFLAAVSRQRLPAADPLELDLQVGAFRLVGRITEFSADGPLGYRCATIKPKDLLEAWVLHLAANLQTAGRRTRWIGSDRQNVFTPPADPAALLESLLNYYWQGLQAPLRCFPKTSSQFVETLRGKPARPPGPGKPKPRQTAAPSPEKAKERAREKALEAARVKWEGQDTARFQNPGEGLDPHFQLCFREPDPLNSLFMEIAEGIFGPLLSHLAEEELP